MRLLINLGCSASAFGFGEAQPFPHQSDLSAGRQTAQPSSGEGIVVAQDFTKRRCILQPYAKDAKPSLVIDAMGLRLNEIHESKRLLGVEVFIKLAKQASSSRPFLNARTKRHTNPATLAAQRLGEFPAHNAPCA